MPPKPKYDKDSLAAFKQDLKEGRLRQLYVFHGQEAYLRQHYLEQLQQMLLPAGLEDFNLHTAQGKDCSVDWIIQAVDCLPMMSQRTMVVVTDFDLYGQSHSNREALLSLFSSLPDYCCLVFVYDLLGYQADGRSKLAAALKAYGLVVDFHPQDQSDLVSWISRHFRAHERTIANEDARYLLFLCGDLMTKLSTEIEKIAAHAAGQRVTREDIDAVATPLIDAIVFQMTDAIARREFDKAASVLADLLFSQEPPLKILAAMGKYFRQLYTAKLYRSSGKGARELMALWHMKYPYPAEKLMDAAKAFSLEWCRFAVARCSQAELLLKDSYGREGEVLTGLLMELAAGKRGIPC